VSGLGSTVVVIGAQGALGRLCVPALRGTGFEVLRAGRRPEGASDFRQVDLGDRGAVADLCAEADLIVSTARHPALAAEQHALREGKTLVSVAAFWPAERARLAALEPAPRGTVILDAGLAPGVSSVVLKDLLARHPEADAVESTGTLSILEPAGRGTAEDTMIAWEGAGRLPTRVIDFPAPVGRRRCVRFVGEAAIEALFGSLAEGRTALAYGCFVERPANAWFLALNSLGVLTRLPERFFTAGSGWREARTTAKPQTHIAAVWKGGRRLAARSITGSGNYRMSAAAIAAYCEVLAGRPGNGAGAGVVGVEDAFALADLGEGLGRRGIRIAEMPTAS
jgi:hypothetical protein